MIKVMVFGTFDGLHLGHIKFFEQAKKRGDYLIVAIARDKTVEMVKNHPAHFNEKERLKIVRSCKLVDKAVLGNKTDPYRVIKEVSPDVICLGYDQKYFTDNLPNELKKVRLKTKVYTMKPYQPKKYHSALINR
ncbi:MAG: adenylyltransferase/cytidyltransferase family protein [bacterium]|nr:adenylyltransferase/cytidyltransferase family protein [bacterium]